MIGATGIDVDDEHAIGIESQRQRGQTPEGREKETGADEKHQGNSHLAHDQARGQIAARSANPALFLDRLDRRRARRADSRTNAEEYCCRDGDARGHAHHAPVEGQIQRYLSVHRRQTGDDRPAGPGSEQQPARGADESHDQTLDQQLSSQAPAWGPKGEPDTHFVAARCCAGKKEVGDVHAGHQQARGQRRRERSSMVASTLTAKSRAIRGSSGCGHKDIGIRQKLRQSRVVGALLSGRRSQTGTYAAQRSHSRLDCPRLQSKHDRQQQRARMVERRARVRERLARSPAAGSRRKGCPTSTPKKSGGITPTIVQGTPSTGSAAPTTLAAPPKRRCHNP